jgi:hypothetical protein
VEASIGQRSYEASLIGELHHRRTFAVVAGAQNSVSKGEVVTMTGL